MKQLLGIKSVYIVMAILTILAFVLGSVYANDYIQTQNELKANVVKIDEEVFGEAIFNSEYYELKPILDEDIIDACPDFDVLSLKYFIAKVKEGILQWLLKR